MKRTTNIPARASRVVAVPLSVSVSEARTVLADYSSLFPEYRLTARRWLTIAAEMEPTSPSTGGPGQAPDASARKRLPKGGA